MDKIKILVIPKDRETKNIKRIVKPHLFLQEQYGEEFFVDIDLEPKLDDDAWLSQYDIIIYHEYLDEDGTIANKFKELGIVGILDIDDNWSINKNYQFYKYIKHQEDAIKRSIINAEHVTTSTPELFTKVKKLNPNVTLITDSVNNDENQFKQKTKKSKKLRFGIIADDYSLENINILKGLVSKLNSDKLLGEVQFVLCGFDLESYKTGKNPITGEDERTKKKPQETTWYQYEKILTNDYSVLSEDYRRHLLNFEDEEFKGENKEPYKRVWTKPVNKFGHYYQEFDVLLAPMDTNSYNLTSSPFRVMEAGFYKKPIIAQDFGPYQIDLENGYTKGGIIDQSKNGLLVNPKKNHKEWYKFVKKLILEQDVVKVLGKNLHNTVKNKYSMKNTTKVKKDLYEKLVKKTK
jgi:glycosyltransferase involved in cell wall biosynthesis